MIPQIQSKPSLYVVGIKQTHRLTEGAPIPTIAEQWGVFAQRRHEIEGHGPVTLGLSLCADPSRGTIDYVAGALVSRLPDAVPDGLEALELEPHTYAVFTHRGPVAGLRQRTRPFMHGSGRTANIPVQPHLNSNGTTSVTPGSMPRTAPSTFTFPC